jgi:hypothetical protein
MTAPDWIAAGPFIGIAVPCEAAGVLGLATCSALPSAGAGGVPAQSTGLRRSNPR